MKALLLKVLHATQNLPARYAVTVQGQKRFVIPMDSDSFDFSSDSPSLINQVSKMAVDYFGFSHLSHHVGQLDNGNHVITLSEPKHLFKCEYLSVKGVTVNEYYLGTKIEVMRVAQKVAIQLGHHQPVINQVNYYVGNDSFKEL